MKRRVEELEREVGSGPRPFEHVSDEELLAAIERLREGKPGGLAPFPGPAESWPTGFEDLSDDEVLARLGAVKASLGPMRHTKSETED